MQVEAGQLRHVLGSNVSRLIVTRQGEFLCRMVLESDLAISSGMQQVAPSRFVVL